MRSSWRKARKPDNLERNGSMKEIERTNSKRNKVGERGSDKQYIYIYIYIIHTHTYKHIHTQRDRRQSSLDTAK